MIEVSRELIAFLREERARCEDSALEDERAAAIDFYNGEPFGDEEDGRSQLVTRDVAEVIDYMVISILRTLVSGDRVVEFLHSATDKAQEATVTLEHLFMEEQNGYMVLHDWLKAGLLEKNAVAMSYPEPQPPKRVEKIVPEPLLGEVEAIEAEEAGEFDGEGNALWRVVVMEEQPPKFCDIAVPNEEFYCSPDARTLQEAALKGRKAPKTVSELVAMGYDADDLAGVSEDEYCDGLLSSARDDDIWTGAEDRRGPNRKVRWREEFVFFDENGDGVAELLFIQSVGDKVFAIHEMEDADMQPFEDWCPFPMPHRRIGQSLADKVMDIQRTRSVILRQSLDGMYLANAPRTFVHEDSIGDSTIDDLLTVRPGSIVRWKGANKPDIQSGQFDAASGFSMLEFMAGERETRTGITRLNQGLDADTLNKTASGQAQLQARGEQYEEYLARNFANALARLFTKKARLLKRYGQPITIQIDGEFKEVDPTQWPDDMIAKPRVGLGSGRKEMRLAYREKIFEAQKLCMEGGLPIVGPEQIFNSMKGAIADMNLGVATDFFIDPATIPPQEPQPDPETQKVQAEMQMKQAELEGKQQEAAMTLQMKQQEGAAKLELMREEAAAKIELEREKAQAEAQLAMQKAQLEAELAMRQQEAEQAMAERRMQVEERMAERNAARAEYETTEKVKLQKNRPGGDLSK